MPSTSAGLGCFTCLFKGNKPLEPKEVVTGVSALAQEINQRKKDLEFLSAEEKKKEAIKIEMDEFILPYINKISPKVTSFSEEGITAKQHLEDFKKVYQNKLEQEGNLFAQARVEEAVERYMVQAKAFVDNTIPIPRISIVPSGDTKLIFHHFNLNTSAINFQPGSENIVSQELQTGEQQILVANQNRGNKNRLEEQLVLLLMDKPEIFYDHHHELLFHLIEQLMAHLATYLNTEEEIRNVINNFKKPITDIIYQQMMEHHEIVSDGFNATQISGRPYSEIKDPSASKNIGDKIFDYKDNIEPASVIRTKVFSGFLKSYHNIYKFDSKTEKDFASILEKDTSVLKWLKPALGQFNIHYGRPPKNYNPDFVVETIEEIWLIETKKEDDIDDKNVVSKSKSALEYCHNASNYNQTVGGKKWRYALIPHNQVKLNMTFDFLVKAFEIVN